MGAMPIGAANALPATLLAQATTTPSAWAAVPPWAWWTAGGLAVAAVIASVVWYYLQGFYRRIAWAALGAIGVGACVPRVFASLNVPGFAEGTFFVDAAPSAAWPLALVAAVALVIDHLHRSRHAPPANASPAAGTAKATGFLGGRPAAASGSGQAASGDGNTQVSRDQHNVGVVNKYGETQLADRLIQQAQENGRLQLQTEQLSAEKEKIETQLAAALARVETKADAGNADARAAIDEARRGDDPAKLQAVLLAQRDQQESHVREHAADWLDLNRQIAAVAYVRGDIDVAVEALNKVLALAKDDLDAINSLGHIHKLRGDLAAAEGQYRRLLDLDASDSWRAVALGNLGLIAQTRGDLDAAERFHNESLAIARTLGSLEMHASTVGNLGLIALTRGDLDAAERFHNESLAIERTLGRLEGQASDLDSLGLVAKARGEFDISERFLNDALALNRKLGRLEYQAIDLGNLGSIAEQRGRIADARRLWTESRDLYARVGIPHMVKQLQGWLDGLPPG